MEEISGGSGNKKLCGLFGIKKVVRAYITQNGIFSTSVCIGIDKAVENFREGSKV